MNEWISVEELPEQGQHIWFTRIGDCGVPITVYGYRLGGSWQDQMHNIRFRTCDVLQWQYMSLPEPPKPPEPKGPFIWSGEFVEYIKDGQVRHSYRPYDTEFLVDWINRVLSVES